MIVAVGHSEELDSADAIAEALDRCDGRLAGSVPQAGFLYAGIEHEFQALLDGVEERYPGLQLVGCTTHGELSSAGFAEDSVVLMLLHSNRVTFRAAVAEGVAADPEGAAQRVAEQVLGGLEEPARLCIAITEALGVDTTALLGRLSREVGKDVPICGGLSAEPQRLEQTYQFCNGHVFTDSLALLVFAGPLHVSTGVGSGWHAVGADHYVTAAEGVVVKEFDGEPVRDVWLRYFGTDVSIGTRNFLAVYPDAPDGSAGSEDDDFYLSVPFQFREDGSLVVSPPIAPGSRFRFAEATREQILTGVDSSAAHAVKTFPGEAPDAGLVFSCAGRHGILGTQVVREYDLLRRHFGADIPTIGFYTYGEFCPLAASVVPRAHSSTFVSVLIGEAE